MTLAYSFILCFVTLLRPLAVADGFMLTRREVNT